MLGVRPSTIVDLKLKDIDLRLVLEQVQASEGALADELVNPEETSTDVDVEDDDARLLSYDDTLNSNAYEDDDGML